MDDNFRQSSELISGEDCMVISRSLDPVACGSVVALHTAPRSMLPMRAVPSLTILKGVGVEGDRYSMNRGFLSDKIIARNETHERMVTLFERETIDALARDHGIHIEASDHRRNITTKGIALNHLIGRRFQIGDVILKGYLAPPCKHLDHVVGQSLFHLLMNRAGLNAGVIQGGVVRANDAILLLRD